MIKAINVFKMWAALASGTLDFASRTGHILKVLIASTVGVPTRVGGL